MQPKSKQNELFERVIAFGKSGERDEFARMALIREIEGLKNKAEAFALRGMLAADEHDETEARESFAKARRIRGSDWWIELNWAKALLKLDLMKEACEQAESVYLSDPSNVESLDTLINCMHFSLRAIEGVRLMEQRAKLKPEGEHQNIEGIQEIAAFFHRHQLRDNEVEPQLISTLDLLHGAGYHSEKNSFFFQQDGESEWLSYHFELALPVETVCELNRNLAEVMARSNIQPNVAPLVNFMFIPSEK